MKIRTTIIAAVIGIASGSAFAQDTRAEADVQRDANQQQRIEQGLQSGQLTTREAGKLERDETRVDRMEKRDMRNGSISPAEQARLNAAQHKASADIARDRHNGVTGNPTSASSQRMQADVQRDANQQQRIENGMQSGQLTNREAGKLERGQAHVNRTEARASRSGAVNANEQARIEGKENRQSNRVWNKKHNETQKY
ncbi:MAG TPA: hypothetical protein VHE37_05380 [Nevskiaceae bacterium]|nr:hypothetical protein [Nevskiaceae bacterium]